MHKKKSSVFPAFLLLVSKVVLIFGPRGGKTQVVLFFEAVLSSGNVLIFWAGVYRWIMTVAGPYRTYDHWHKLCDCAGVVRA